MKAVQRAPYLEIVRQNLTKNTKHRPSLCDLCAYQDWDWDGDEYTTHKYPICGHPLPALNEREEYPAWSQKRNGIPLDCWGFRPREIEPESACSVPDCDNCDNPANCPMAAGWKEIAQ